jgi:hypothetical protein
MPNAGAETWHPRFGYLRQSKQGDRGNNAARASD